MPRLYDVKTIEHSMSFIGLLSQKRWVLGPLPRKYIFFGYLVVCIVCHVDEHLLLLLSVLRLQLL